MKKAVLLNNGVAMPPIGYGVFRMTDPEVCEEAVVQAIQAGYRFIDTAAAYGNEEAVGRAIRRCGVPRKELFISTKLWIPDISYPGGQAGLCGVYGAAGAFVSGPVCDPPALSRLLRGLAGHGGAVRGGPHPGFGVG